MPRSLTGSRVSDIGKRPTKQPFLRRGGGKISQVFSTVKIAPPSDGHLPYLPSKITRKATGDDRGEGLTCLWEYSFSSLPANTRVKRQSTEPEIGHRLETPSQPSTWNIYPVKKSNKRLTPLSSVQRNIEKNRSSRFEKYGWATRYRYTLCRISCTHWPGCKRVCGQTKRHCAPRLSIAL